MRKAKTPEPLTSTLWPKAEDYSIRADGAILANGGTTHYDLSNVVLHEEMFDSLMGSFRRFKETGNRDSLLDWLRQWGLPVQGSFIARGNSVEGCTFDEFRHTTESLYLLEELRKLISAATYSASNISVERLRGMITVEDDPDLIDPIALYPHLYPTFPAGGHALIQAYLFTSGGVDALNEAQKADLEGFIRKVRKDFSKYQVVRFHLKGDWRGIFYWAPDSILSPGQPIGTHLGPERFVQLYPKGEWSKKNSTNVVNAAKVVLRHALETGMHGVLPSAEFKQDPATGEWNLHQSVRVRSPWDALNYVLYRRALDRHTSYVVCECGCGRTVRAARSTKKYFDDLCRLRANRAKKGAKQKAMRR